MYRSLFLLWVLISQVVTSLGQNLLRLTKEKHWSEELTWSESAATAVEEFSYNEPGVLDEEHSHVVYIKFLRPTTELVGTTIHLPEDSGSVDVRYHLSSVWFWAAPRPVRAKGEIRVIAASSQGLTLDHDFNFSTNEREDGKFRLVGERNICKGPLDHFRGSYLW